MHIIVPSDIRMSFLGVSYLHGGAYEIFGRRGISHLMEHLMCKTSDDMREELRSLGIDSNAYTSDNRVVFWWSGLDRALAKVSDRLYNRLTNQPILWTKEQFENEKKTVLEEYGDTFNSQLEGTYFNALRQFYNYTGAIGYRKDIEDFTYEQSLEMAKQFKKPHLVCEVGQKNLSLPNAMLQDASARSLIYDDYLLKKQISLEEVPKDSKAIVGMISTNPYDGNITNKVDFLINCITGGLESPLYQEIREKRGLSYYSMGFTTRVHDSGVVSFFASTANENISELEKVYDDFFSTSFETLVTKERFDICHQNLMIKKEIAEILPHSGVRTTILSETSPFENMDTFTYDDAIQLSSVVFNRNILKPITY